MSDAIKPRNVWLRTAPWDGFWMLSGIWLLAPLFFFTRIPEGVQGALIVATFILWLSHRFATTYNVFCTPAYRSLIREDKTRFLLWPAVTIFLTFGFVFAPKVILPLDTWNRIQFLGTIFFIYNSYHFGVQHYGVLSIYRNRAGQSYGGWLKRYEKTYCIAVGTVSVAMAQVCHGAEVVRDSMIYNFFPHSFFATSFSVLRVVVPILVMILTAVFFWGESQNKPLSIPKILYVTGLALQGILAYFLEPMSFLFLWGVQHWLVSVALGAHMTQNDTSELPINSRWYRFWNIFNKGFWPTVVILSLISIALTPFFQFSVHPEKMIEVRFFSFLPLIFSNLILLNLLIAINFSSVYIHFIMDRAIFRFSDPATRKISIPLLFAQSSKK